MDPTLWGKLVNRVAGSTQEGGAGHTLAGHQAGQARPGPPSASRGNTLSAPLQGNNRIGSAPSGAHCTRECCLLGTVSQGAARREACNTEARAQLDLRDDAPVATNHAPVLGAARGGGPRGTCLVQASARWANGGKAACQATKACLNLGQTSTRAASGGARAGRRGVLARQGVAGLTGSQSQRKRPGDARLLAAGAARHRRVGLNADNKRNNQLTLLCNDNKSAQAIHQVARCVGAANAVKQAAQALQPCVRLYRAAAAARQALGSCKSRGGTRVPTTPCFAALQGPSVAKKEQVLATSGR